MADYETLLNKRAKGRKPRKKGRELRMQRMGGGRFGPLPLPPPPSHTHTHTCFTLYMMSYTRKVTFPIKFSLRASSPIWES